MTKTLCSGGVIETIINKINKILFIILFIPVVVCCT